MSKNELRPIGWAGKRIPTIWVDYATGRGVTDSGTPVRPNVGERRKKPNLTDMLDTAANYGAERVMFTGNVPPVEPAKTHWLYADTPGWKAGAHWTKAPVTGRFERTNTGQNVEIRTAAEWFEKVELKPAEAREAWDVLDAILHSIDDRAGLLKTPGMTGTNLWAWSLPKNVEPWSVSADIAEEIHLTAGQHHIEHLVAGKNFDKHPDCVPLIDPKVTPTIDTFAHVDGRFMYASLGRELGVGPGIRHSKAAAQELFARNKHTRSRFEIRFTIPDNWRHVGLLPMKHTNVSDGWYFPNRPGTTGTTWVDASEAFVADAMNWNVEVLQAVEFQTSRVFDNFSNWIVKARESVDKNDELPAPIRKAVRTGLRSILVQGIGSLASRGRERTVVVRSAFDVPAEYKHTMDPQGDRFTYRERSEPTDRQKRMYHPEIAAQIWGRGRAKILRAPVSYDAKGHASGGALNVNPRTLIGVNGDAIYTTAIPHWALPTEHGGGDDGKTGRLRLVSVETGEMPTPDSLEARRALTTRAAVRGPFGAWTDLGDGPAN